MLSDDEVGARLRAAADAVRRSAPPTDFARVRRAHRRRVTARSVATAAAVAVVTVAVLLGVGQLPGVGSGHGVEPAGPTRSPGPPHAGALFQPQPLGVRLTPGGVGVVIGDRCARPSRCAFAAVVTADGGRSWSMARTPSGVTMPNPPARQVLAFGDRDWWAALPGLFASHDRGRTWTAVPTGGPLVAAAASRTDLWVVRQRCRVNNDCTTATVASTPAAGGPLTPLTTQPPPNRSTVTQLVHPDAATGYLLDLTGRMIVTRDGGRSWQVMRLPCPVGEGRGSVELAADAPGSLWLACYPAANGMSGGRTGRLLRSTNGGRTWTPAESDLPELDPLNPPALVAVDASTCWLTEGGGRLRRSTDGGRTWQPTAPIGRWDELLATATSARDAVVVAQPFVRHAPLGVLVTTDAGRHWRVAGRLPR